MLCAYCSHHAVTTIYTYSASAMHVCSACYVEYYLPYDTPNVRTIPMPVA